MTLRRFALCMVTLLGSGCERAEPNDHLQVSVDSSAERLISLSPAVTALLQDLELGNHLVGRSAFCRGVDMLPVVGDLGGADIEAVIRLQPDVLLYQATAAPPPAGLMDAAKITKAQVHGVAVDDIDDLHNAIDSIVRIMDPMGSNAPLRARGAAAHDALHAATQPSNAPRRNVRVLLIQPGASMLAWGGETWLGRVIAAAGGQPLLHDRAWVTVSAEDVVRLQPDVIFVLGERSGMELGAIATLPTPAMHTGRVLVLSHPRLLIPGIHASAVRALIDDLLWGRLGGPESVHPDANSH